MLKKICFLLSIFIVFSTNAISGVTSVNVAESTFTITGTGLGSVSIDSSYLKGNIESGVNNAEISLPAGWYADITGSARQRPVYSNEYSHCGSKSIKSHTPLESQYTSGFWFDKPAGFQKMYATWWVRARGFQFLDGYTTGQWKTFRVTPGLAGGVYEDQPHNWYWSQQLQNGSMEDGNNLFINFCSSNSVPTYDTSCFAGNPSGGSGGIYRINGISTDVWQRIEVWVEQSSVSSQDGTIYTTIQTEGYLPITFTDYAGNTCTRQSEQYPWKDIVWENYIGNGLTNATIYIDDVYAQFGTRARVEVGNNSVLANCTHREIQPVLTWADTGITGVFNQGSFNNGDTVYFFVIDENGIPSDGYAVIIGGETPPDPPAPSSITNTSLSHGVLRH